MTSWQVYLNWVNSVLSDSGQQLDGIADIQQGEVICQLIDSLCPHADLHYRASSLGERTPVSYLEQAVNYLKDNGVRVQFTCDDIYHGDIKSILDLLWIIILNFSIHKTGRSTQKRTIRNGKKLILRWCQRQLPNGTWNLNQSVVNNLCFQDNFVLLLQRFADADCNSQDKTSCLYKLLEEIEFRYKIKKEIIQPDELVDGTVDEHNLLIYLSLLRQRVGVGYESDESSDESLLSESSLNLTVDSSRMPSMSIEFGKNLAESNASKKFQSSPRFGRSPSPSTEPLSAILKTYANGDSPTSREKVTNTPSRKAVSFSPKSDKMADDQSRATFSVDEDRKSGANEMRDTYSAGRQESPSPIRYRNGRFSSGYSPTRYAKSFEIPPEKKRDLENRMRAVNGNRSLNNSHPTTDTNGFSEDTSDWFSSDMESRSTAQERPLHKTFLLADTNSPKHLGKITDAINKKVTDMIPRSEMDQCMDDSLGREKHFDSRSAEKPSNQPLYPATNIPGLQGPNYFADGNNFRIPVGGVPMFGMGTGPSVVSGYGGVPLFLLPGHGPEATRLLNALQQHQPTEHSPADITDGAISVGDDSRNESRLETSVQTSEDGHGEHSNMTGGSSFFNSPHKGDDSKTELKQIADYNCSSNPYSISTTQANERVANRDLHNEIPSIPCSHHEQDKSTDVTPSEDDTLKKIQQLREALQNPNPRLKPEISINDEKFHTDEESRENRSTRTSRERQTDQLSISHVKLPQRDNNLTESRRDKDERERARRSESDGDSSGRHQSRERQTQEQENFLAQERKALEHNRSSSRYSSGNRSQEQDDLLTKDVVQMLTNELKDLKSKVDTLERSQESGEVDSHEELRRKQLFETSSRSPQRSPQRSRTHSPQRSPTRSPHRSILHPPEKMDPNVHKANKQVQQNVDDLIFTMQNPLSRNKPPNSPYPRKCQDNKLETNGHFIREKIRRDLSARPSLAFSDLRSHSEDRFDRRKSGPQNSSEKDEEWKSQSFHGEIGRKDEELEVDDYYRNRSKSLEDLSGNKMLTTLLNEDELIVKPPSAAPIDFGYSSPVHKISSDIWGMDMKDLDNLEQGRQQKWKKMTEAKKFMTDSEIIELKQCLASATMENEILRAKVHNASHEISEKLTKVAAVLEETKLCLIRTQSENEELKSTLKKEREKAQVAELRARDSEAVLQKVKFENDRLDLELREANFLLQGLNKEGLHEMEEDNRVLRRKLDMAATEEKKVLEELGRVKEIRDRSLGALKDLRTSLIDTRDHNDKLQEELAVVKTQEKSYKWTATLLSRAKDINEQAKKRDIFDLTTTTNHRSKKGQDQMTGSRQIDAEDKYSQHTSNSPAVSDRVYGNHGNNTTSTPYTRLKGTEPLMTSSPSSGRYEVHTGASPSEVSPVVKSSDVPRSYNYEEISPAISISRREIYPHRRPKYALPRSRKDFSVNDDGRTNNDNEISRRKWSVACPLNFSDYDLNESLTNPQLGDNDRRFDERLTPAKPPRPSSASTSRADYHSSLSRSPSGRDRAKMYSNKYEPRSNLTRSYRSEEDFSKIPMHNSHDHNSSLQHFSSDVDYAYHTRSVSHYSPTRDRERKLNLSTPASSSRLATGYDREMKMPLHGERDDVTPRHYYGYVSQVNVNAPVRGILKSSSSEQDLRKISRYSPPHRHLTSPNVTFNTEVESRNISPKGTWDKRSASSKSTDNSIAGEPLFSGPSRRYGVVRNLNYDFEDEEPVRDVPRQSTQGFRTKSRLDSKHSPEIPVLTSHQREYVDQIIDKYVSRRQGYDDSSVQTA